MGCLKNLSEKATAVKRSAGSNSENLFLYGYLGRDGGALIASQMIVIKLAIQLLLLKAGLISLFVCGIGLFVRAESGAKILQLRPGMVTQPKPENQLLTLTESIEALEKARASIGNSTDSKSEILAAIEGVGADQFEFDFMPRETIDNLIASLLRLYGRDEEVSAAITNKLSELSKNKNGFLRFLSYQLELKISLSSVDNFPRYLPIFESIQTHSSQLDILWVMYSKALEPGIRQRIFKQIYNVLMDPDLQHNGQFSPDHTVASAIRKLLKSVGDRPLEIEELNKISNLIARFEKIKNLSGSSIQYVLSSIVRLTAQHPEFETKLAEYVKKTYQIKPLLEALQAQLERNVPISAVQARVLKSLPIEDEKQKKWRIELLRGMETGNIYRIKRATPTCHSFYGL
mgnify:CR=1 FL=1